MKLSEKLNNKTIIYPLQAMSKQDALHELLDYFQSLDYLTATTKLFSYLDSKDKTFNSASGRGVAYHYHTSIEVKETLAVLGISKQGINYNATDGLLCHFILLILEPTNHPNSHRKLINLFQNLINHSDIKSKLLELDSSSEVEKIIKNWENDDNVFDIL